MSLVFHGLLLLLLALLLHGQAAAETVIEEYEDRVVVQIIGDPEAVGTRPAQPLQPAVQAVEQAVAEDHTMPSQQSDPSPEQTAELKTLREEASRLRLPVQGETPEQSLERRARAAEAQARLRNLEQALKVSQRSGQDKKEP